MAWVVAFSIAPSPALISPRMGLELFLCLLCLGVGYVAGIASAIADFGNHWDAWWAERQKKEPAATMPPPLIHVHDPKWRDLP